MPGQIDRWKAVVNGAQGVEQIHEDRNVFAKCGAVGLKINESDCDFPGSSVLGEDSHKVTAVALERWGFSVEREMRFDET
jgi:hypothetical protein